MFKSLYYRLRYGSYLSNNHGIKKFAEMHMSQLIRKVTKESARYREQSENLMVEKANLRMREEELMEKPSLDPGAFFSVRRRLWAENGLVVFILAASVFLNFIAVTAFVPGETLGYDVLRWALAATVAIVLTGGGLTVTQRLIESFTDDEQHPGLGVMWGALLIATLVAILGVTQVRAAMLSEEIGSSLLYYGYMIGSMVLPLLAGALRWDALSFIDVYKTTQSLRQIQSRLAQIDSMIRQSDEYESNFYKVKSITYWDSVNEFKAIKDNYNESNGITEPLKDHFARSYDSFQKEAAKRYETDIRDILSGSIRRLDKSGKKSSKLDSSEQPRPPKSGGSSRSDRSSEQPKRKAHEKTGSDGDSEYFEIQPVR